MTDHNVSITHFSQEDLLWAGCFDLRMAMQVAEKAMIAFEEHQIMFPDKIVQVFNPATQERINCLPATLLNEKICGLKWVSVFPRNPKNYGVQNLSAVFILSEIETGFPIAIMEGTLASNMRVAAMGGIAAKYLARKDSEVIGFIGAGEQAKMHLLAMKIVFPGLAECRVASRTLAREQKFIQEMSPLFPDLKFVAAQTHGKMAMEGADILVTATSAQAPLLKADWMKPGSFYSHVGGWEDEFKVAEQCDKIVCDNWDTVTHRSQTLSLMYADGLLSSKHIYADLHELVSGQKIGRKSDEERIYFNAVGLAYIDVAIALAMYHRAIDAHAGRKLPIQECMVFEHPNITGLVKI